MTRTAIGSLVARAAAAAQIHAPGLTGRAIHRVVSLGGSGHGGSAHDSRAATRTSGVAAADAAAGVPTTPAGASEEGRTCGIHAADVAALVPGAGR